MAGRHPSSGAAATVRAASAVLSLPPEQATRISSFAAGAGSRRRAARKRDSRGFLRAHLARGMLVAPL